MSSEAITRNDLIGILNEVLPPTPSEYKKLLWTNPSPASSFSAQTISLNLSDYDCVEIETYLSPNGMTTTRLTEVGKMGEVGGLGSAGDRYTRMATVSATGITFTEGKTNGTTNNANAIPYKIYGIKYERVQPPVLDAEIEVLVTGITLYRIGRIRALHISDATGFTKSSLIPSADRPSADVQGVAIRTTNGNLATSFGRIVVGANGDVGALYSTVLNGSQTGFSIASTTDHIIGTAIWYIAE